VTATPGWLFLVLLAALQIPSPARADSLIGQATVIDGDTLEIHNKRIRMAGIDAPESRQLCVNADAVEYRCGKDAAFALADYISRAPVSCHGIGHDRYGRLIATCSAHGVNLNAWMVENGYAVAYRHYSGAYVEQEEAAKIARRGVWAGSFQMPWDWRKTHR